MIIAYAYPPYTAAGSARAAKVAEAFRRAGHTVLVLTSRLPGEGKGPRIAVPGLTVQPIATIPHPRHLLAAIKRLLPGREAPAGTRGAAPDPDAGDGRPRPAWKRHLLSLLMLPDDVQGFIPPAVARVLWRFPQVDLVYTTSPPASCHLAGLLLKLMTDVRWVMELRDPWYPQRGPLTSWERHRIERWLEHQCLRRADQVVSVSEGIHDLVSGRLDEEGAKRCAVIRNGIDDLRPFAPASDAAGPARILYLGTLYWKRSPKLLLEGLARLVDRLGLKPGDLRMDFVGNCRSLGAVSVEGMVGDLGLADYVHFHDWVSQADALTLLEAATILVLLAQEQPTQVPNKLYEYLGTRKPIVAIADSAGETARMLRSVDGHFLATELDDASTMADLLERALRRRSSDERDPRRETLLDEWTAKRQMDRLMETLRTRGLV